MNKTCDICHSQVGQEYVDGKTVYGPWANMCTGCFNTVGIGLGVGLGQMYRWSDQEQKYKKIKG